MCFRIKRFNEHDLDMILNIARDEGFTVDSLSFNSRQGTFVIKDFGDYLHRDIVRVLKEVYHRLSDLISHKVSVCVDLFWDASGVDELLDNHDFGTTSWVRFGW